MSVTTEPCGGCGEPDPKKACIGCLHFHAPTTRETADHAELARLAEAATVGEWWSDDDVISHQEVSREDERFIYAFTPAVCSALLSEIAALRGDLTETRVAADLLVSSVRADLRRAERQRDEAVGLLRELWQSVYCDMRRSPAAPITLGTIQKADAARAFLANQGADQWPTIARSSNGWRRTSLSANPRYPAHYKNAGKYS